MSPTSNDGRSPLPIKLAGQYGQPVPSKTNPRGENFANLIRNGRQAAGISQDALAEQAGLNRSTVIRWESGDASRPDPDQVRRVCQILHIDPRRAAISLGYLTQEEVDGVPRSTLAPAVEEVLDILGDPTVPDTEKNEWIAYLRYLRDKRRPQAG